MVLVCGSGDRVPERGRGQPARSAPTPPRRFTDVVSAEGSARRRGRRWTAAVPPPGWHVTRRRIRCGDRALPGRSLPPDHPGRLCRAVAVTGGAAGAVPRW